MIEIVHETLIIGLHFRCAAVEQALKDLEEEGVAVIPNILTDAECDQQIQILKDWLARFGDDQFPENVSSIIHQYNIGHSETSWTCRLKAKHIFDQIFGTEKLLTSFDGLAISQPPESGKTKFSKEALSYDGLHLDQGPRRLGLHAIQGSLYLEEAKEEDWCFKVITKSHKYFEEFFDEYKPNPHSEHRKLKKPEVNWYLEKGGKVKRIACPKGGMILWDSRTVHAGAPPVSGRENTDRWRYCVFVCLSPAKWASEKDYGEKQHGYSNMRTSRHWPANGFSLFREFEKHPGLDIAELPDIAKTEEGQYLAGVMRYEFTEEDLPDWYPELRSYPDYELPY